MSIRSSLREFLTGLMETADRIVVADAAGAFIAKHSAELDDHMKQVVTAWVSNELKSLCSERAEDRGQLAMFAGLPMGIVIAPGVVKPRRRCTWADLIIGRQERVANIAHAEKALHAYDRDLDFLRPLMELHPALTVDEAAKRLAEETS